MERRCCGFTRNRGAGFSRPHRIVFPHRRICTLHRHRGPLRFKNPVLMLLYFGMAAASLLFYWSTSFAFPLMAGTLFSAFINPPAPCGTIRPGAAGKLPLGLRAAPRPDSVRSRCKAGGGAF